MLNGDNILGIFMRNIKSIKSGFCLSRPVECKLLSLMEKKVAKAAGEKPGEGTHFMTAAYLEMSVSGAGVPRGVDVFEQMAAPRKAKTHLTYTIFKVGIKSHVTRQ